MYVCTCVCVFSALTKLIWALMCVCVCGCQTGGIRVHVCVHFVTTSKNTSTTTVQSDTAVGVCLYIQ